MQSEECRVQNEESRKMRIRVFLHSALCTLHSAPHLPQLSDYATDAHEYPGRGTAGRLDGAGGSVAHKGLQDNWLWT